MDASTADPNKDLVRGIEDAERVHREEERQLHEAEEKVQKLTAEIRQSEYEMAQFVSILTDLDCITPGLETRKEEIEFVSQKNKLASVIQENATLTSLAISREEELCIFRKKSTKMRVVIKRHLNDMEKFVANTYPAETIAKMEAEKKVLHEEIGRVQEALGPYLHVNCEEKIKDTTSLLNQLTEQKHSAHLELKELRRSTVNMTASLEALTNTLAVLQEELNAAQMQKSVMFGASSAHHGEGH